MSVITTATGEEVISLLTKLNNAVAGMTAEEAASYLSLQAGKIASSSAIISTPGSAIAVDAASAAEAYDAYIAAGGTVSGFSALSQSGAAAASVTEIIDGAGVATAGGILSLSVPVAVAAVAPVLGVAVGAGLYSLAPDFWTTISNAIFGTDCPYPSTEVVPAVVDKNGQVYISKDIVDAIKGVFDTIKGSITPDSSTNLPSPIPCVLTSIVQYTSGGNLRNTLTTNIPVKFSLWVDSTSSICIASKNVFTLTLTTDKLVDGVWTRNSQTTTTMTPFTYNSKTFYYFYSESSDISQAFIQSIFPVATIYKTNASHTYDAKCKILSTIAFGDIVKPYPSGLSDYTGNIPVDYTQNKIDVVTDPTDIKTQPYYPIRIPVGDPGVTTSPLVNPNPQSPNTAPEITPYVSPEVSPQQYPQTLPVPSTKDRTATLVDPIPRTDVQINPTTDTLQPSTETPPAIPNPPLPPISAGITPDIIFPPVGPWPTIIPSADSGLIHVYNPTADELVAFGKWLWVTYADASIEKIWNNPFDGVISAHELYATPATDGTDSIRSGFLVCPTTAALVKVRYTSINCGSIAIPEHYGNYLDYSPYSKAHVYLPFIGIVELNVDDIVGHGVNITYHIDSYNGSCIAQITVAKTGYANTVYQFSGNCAVELPLSGGSQASIKAGMIAAAATGISSVVGSVASGVTGNIGGAVSGAAYGLAGAVSHAVSQKSSVQHSGSFGASYGAMGVKKPYIIIHNPVEKEVVNYNQQYGFPAHKMVTIGTCQGYLRVREVHVNIPTATDDEKALIEKKLKEGVYVT